MCHGSTWRPRLRAMRGHRKSVLRTKAGRELHSLAEDCKESECEVQRENTAWQPSLFLTKVTAETKLSVKGIIY